MKILAIDDVRDFEKAWLIARTYKMGIIALRDFGPWDQLYLDHDLGHVHREFTESKELTGYDVCLFLEENPSVRPKIIYLVTANPVGKAKMEAALRAMRYVHAVSDPSCWEREEEV